MTVDSGNDYSGNDYSGNDDSGNDYSALPSLLYLPEGRRRRGQASDKTRVGCNEKSGQGAARTLVCMYVHVHIEESG